MSGFDEFHSLAHFKMKNGLKGLFWHDICYGDQPLKVQFLDLFRMVGLKKATLHQMAPWNGNQNP